MFWGTGEKGYLFKENNGQILRGTGEQRKYWGTGNIRKQIFDFWGTGEQANLFQGNKGTVISNAFTTSWMTITCNFLAFRNQFVVCFDLYPVPSKQFR